MTEGFASPQEIETLFTRSDGGYLFARWGRPVVPVVFGVEEETLRVVKGAVEAIVALAGHRMAETDPELGANFMLFFLRDWQELLEVPHLDRLIPELGDLVPRLETADANQYRIFRFDPQGGIRACFSFARVDEQLEAVPSDVLALSLTVQAILLWSDRAFAERSALIRSEGGDAILRPEIAALIRASYDPGLPAAARDASHALRFSARVGAGGWN